MGHSCPAAHGNGKRRGRKQATVAWHLPELGLDILYSIYVESEITREQCMLRGETSKWRKGKERNGVQVLPATDCAASYARRSSVIKKASEDEWYVEARQRAQGRKERHRSMSDGKGVDEKASDRATGLK